LDLRDICVRKRLRRATGAVQLQSDVCLPLAPSCRLRGIQSAGSALYAC